MPKTTTEARHDIAPRKEVQTKDQIQLEGINTVGKIKDHYPAVPSATTRRAMITRPPGAASPNAEDPFFKFANEAGGNFGKGVISYRDHKYYLGEKEVALGAKFVAHVSEMKRGWRRFGKDGEENEFRLHYVREDVPIEEREALGCMDESEWPKNDDGERIDPYQFAYYLPIEDLETGEMYTFGTVSEGGKSALRDLAREYATYKKLGWMLIISLQTSSYYSKKWHRDTAIPVLQVETWEPVGMPAEDAPAPVKTYPADRITSGSSLRGGEMDDDIPFSPETRG
jgi:hypothetical protein